MLTNSINHLKKLKLANDNDAVHHSISPDIQYAKGYSLTMEAIIKSLEENLNDEISEAAKEGYAEDFLQGMLKAHTQFLDTFSLSESRTDRTLSTCVYKVKVDLTETSHPVSEYTETIRVEAPIGLNMLQLKDFIIHYSPFCIEEYVNPQTDTKDYVAVEIYDFDIELLEIIPYVKEKKWIRINIVSGKNEQ